MGRRLLTSFCNIVIVLTLLEYQAAGVTGNENRTIHIALPNVVLPNSTTAHLFPAGRDSTTEHSTTKEQTTPGIHNNAVTNTPLASHESQTTTADRTVTTLDSHHKTASTSAHHESTSPVALDEPITNTTLAHHESTTTTPPVHHDTSTTAQSTAMPRHSTAQVTKQHSDSQTSTVPDSHTMSPHNYSGSSKKPLSRPITSSSHSTNGSHSTKHSNSVSTSKAVFEPYSWWKIVVALVIFCAMAGIILWILKVTEGSSCKKNNGKEDSDIEDSSDTLSEKISTSRV